MEKINIDLPFVNKDIKWKIGITTVGDPQKNPYKGIVETTKFVHKFNYKNSIYTSIHPSYSLAIEIKSKGDESDPLANSIYMYGAMIYQFIRMLDDVIIGFKEKDLYAYDQNHHLIVNKDLASSRTYRFPANRGLLMIRYVVVAESNSDINGNTGTEYEGVAFIVNNFRNFVCLTYDELRNMRDILKTTDFLNLTLTSALVSSRVQIDGR